MARILDSARNALINLHAIVLISNSYFIYFLLQDDNMTGIPKTIQLSSVIRQVWSTTNRLGNFPKLVHLKHLKPKNRFIFFIPVRLYIPLAWDVINFSHQSQIIVFLGRLFLLLFSFLFCFYFLEIYFTNFYYNKLILSLALSCSVVCNTMRYY